jgi:hypothetical protein
MTNDTNSFHELASHLKERMIHKCIDMPVARKIGIANFRNFVKTTTDEEMVKDYLTDAKTKQLRHDGCDVEYVKEQCERGRVTCFEDFQSILDKGTYWYCSRMISSLLTK